MYRFEDDTITTFGDAPDTGVTPDDILTADGVIADKEEKQKEDESEQREEQEAQAEQLDDKEVPAPEDEISADSMTGVELEQADKTTLASIRFMPHYSIQSRSQEAFNRLLVQKQTALTTRRFKETLEYGTPAGVDEAPEPSGSCPGCNDVGDAIIIDASIVETEGSTKGENEDEGTSTNMPEENTAPEPTPEESAELPEDDEDTNVEKELKALFRIQNHMFLNLTTDKLVDASKIYGAETIFDLLKGMIVHAHNLLSRAFVGLVKYGRRTYKYCRNRYFSAEKRYVACARFWKSKLNENLSAVDAERFAESEANVFPYEVWTRCVRAVTVLNNFILHTDTAVFDRSKEVICKPIKEAQNVVEQTGTKIGVGKDRLDTEDLMSQHKFGSMKQLGYTLEILPNCIRQLSQLSECVHGGDSTVLTKSIDNTMEKLAKRSAVLIDDTKEGNIDLESREYKEQQARIIVNTARIDFTMSAYRLNGMLISLLMEDMVKIFSKVEDCLVSKKFV